MRLKEKLMRKRCFTKKNWCAWLINYIFGPIKDKIMCLLKRDTTKDYRKPTRGNIAYAERKARESKINNQLEDNVLKNARNLFKL